MKDYGYNKVRANIESISYANPCAFALLYGQLVQDEQ